MTVEQLIERVRSAPETIEFDQVMAVIGEYYDYTPAHFSNGDVVNEAGSNEGSCKVFAFAQLHSLTDAQTLACFGAYYREDVLQNPGGTDHQNIRNFMKTGWDSVVFETAALKPIE